MAESSYTYHYKYNLKLALPIVFAHVGHMVTALSDSIMVGRVGTIELAAAALANSIFMLVLVFGIGISFGITPSVAVADGKKEYDKLSSVLINGLVVFTAISVILFLTILPLSGVLRYLNQPPDVVELAIPYFNILGFSLIPLMVFMTLKQFSEGLSLTRQAMAISLSANLINIGLNYMLIYGKLGFPAMGLNGAGWATLISRILMAAAMVVFIKMPVVAIRYNIKLKIQDLSKEVMRKLLSVGFPISLQMLLEVGAFVFAAVMVGWMGARELAAHQIALSIAAITFMVASGFASAGTVRVGNYFGLKDFHELRKVGFSILHMVVAFMAFSAVVFILGRKVLPVFFVEEQAVIDIASSLLIIASLFQLADGIQAVGMGVLRGMEDVNKPTIIAILSYWVVGLPIGYVLAFPLNYGIMGMWAGLMIGLNTAAILLTWRFHWLSRYHAQKKILA